MCSEMSILFKTACDYLGLDKGLDIYASLIQGYRGEIIENKHAWNFILIGTGAFLADMREDERQWKQKQTNFFNTNSQAIL